jgi:UDP-N-acetyl-D-glucosamine dehydrogenase
LNTLKKLHAKIEDRSYEVAIVGLGYVGLPLMWTFHEAGLPVVGIDIDQQKVENLKQGKPYIKHLGEEMMQKLAASQRCDASTDFSRMASAQAIIMCVPTPLNIHREPDMSFVEATTQAVAQHLQPGHLVILESTTYPGTTEELMVPILEKASGLKAGKDFYVAYSPEREDPGNANFNTAQIPKVVGGMGKEALDLALALYNTAIVKTVPVTNCKTAEAVKLTENIFRSVNIALVNELKMVYQAMDIDVHEVLEAADTKPFGFMKFTPGPGLGGHCIPIDPFYLTWKAREYEQHTRFIELAGEVNTSMPYYVVERTMHALNQNKKALNGSRILLMGLAYKPDVDDMRESPTFKIMSLLEAKGATVEYHDPFIPEILPTREHAQYTGKKSVALDAPTLQTMDAAVIVTNHTDIDYQALGQHIACVVDTRNVNKTVNNPNWVKA